MAIPPLEQRLGSILPDPAAPAAGEVPLEPFPIEAPAESPDMLAGDPGSPSMDGMQVAGLGSILRKAVTKAEPSAGRRILSDVTPPGELPQAGKVGRMTVIPEADQALADKVKQATEARQAAGATKGKPSPTTAERAAGVPVEPFNLSRYQTDDAAAVVGGVADALGIKTQRVTFDEIKQKAEASGISESFLARLTTPDGGMLPSAVDTYKALQVLESSAVELDRLFKLVDSGMATDVDKLALRQQIAFHGLVQKGVKGIQTETARALAVMRSLISL